MPCDKDFPDSIITILFICLIVACAGILIFAAFTAMHLPTTADATQFHDGTMYVTPIPPHKNLTSTFWIKSANETHNMQEITPIVLGETAFFFYPNNPLNTTGSVLHNLVHYDPYTDQIITYPAVHIHGNFVWARSVLALHDHIQIMNQTITELENEIDSLQEKLGKQGKRIQKLETLILN